MTSVRDHGERAPEFDDYAATYLELIDDPLRNRFAHDPLHFHRRKWWLLEPMLRRAGADPRKLRWLDVGCGQGEVLEIAGGSFASATGCDPSAGMIAAQRAFPRIVQPSLTELPFADASVDFVTAVCVFHHVHGDDRAWLCREIRRVLTPGGLCCIVEHNPWNPVTRAIVKRCPVDVDAELLTTREAVQLLKSAEFSPLCTNYFLYLPETLYPRLRMVEAMFTHVPLGGQYALLARASA